MKIGFFCLPLSGHLNPMTAIARKLQSRGHESSVLSEGQNEGYVQSVCNRSFLEAAT